MISYISGYLVEINDNNIVVDVNGIGYKVFVSSYTLSELNKKTGEKIKLHTYLNVKEDALVLFGFSSKQELALFEKLISVNGIGPKVALNLLSVVSPQKIIAAIISNDLKALVSLPGVGKKTAQRIILELKDKMDISVYPDLDVHSVNIEQSVYLQAIQALVNLGYPQKDATQMVDKVKQDHHDVEGLIKAALKESI